MITSTCTKTAGDKNQPAGHVQCTMAVILVEECFVRTKLSRLRLGIVTVMNVTVATVARYYLQVAVGDVDMALGTDNGGSVRLPSCWCGTVGLKPTFGLVPYTGIMPMDRCLDHAGPMAKTVHDCALLLEVDYCGAL